MKELFNKTTTENPTPTLGDFKRKCQTILNYIGCKWYFNNMSNPKPPTKKPRLSKKYQEEEDNLKVLLKVLCDH